MFACSWLLATALSLGLTAQSNPPAQQTIDPAFRADIVKLLNMTGAASLGQQLANAMLDPLLEGMNTSENELPARAIEIVKEVMRAEFREAFEAKGGLMEQMITIYAHHLTQDEVRGLIAFYGTELGRKVIAILPGMTQESLKAGQEWAAQITPHVSQVLRERLKAEGFIKQGAGAGPSNRAAVGHGVPERTVRGPSLDPYTVAASQRRGIARPG